MEILNTRMQSKLGMSGNISMRRVLLLIFVPTSLLTLTYFLAGHVLQNAIPSLLLFFLLAMLILFPIEIYVVLSGSKREYGRYSLKSGFSNHQKLSWWKIFIYGLLLLTFAGIMSVTIAPLENMLFAPITKRLTHIIPPYFDWNNMDYLKHYSKSILWLTCVIYEAFSIKRTVQS